MFEGFVEPETRDITVHLIIKSVLVGISYSLRKQVRGKVPEGSMCSTSADSQ